MSDTKNLQLQIDALYTRIRELELITHTPGDCMDVTKHHHENRILDLTAQQEATDKRLDELESRIKFLENNYRNGEKPAPEDCSAGALNNKASPSPLAQDSDAQSKVQEVPASYFKAAADTLAQSEGYIDAIDYWESIDSGSISSSYVAAQMLNLRAMAELTNERAKEPTPSQPAEPTTPATGWRGIEAVLNTMEDACSEKPAEPTTLSDEMLSNLDEFHNGVDSWLMEGVKLFNRLCESQDACIHRIPEEPKPEQKYKDADVEALVSAAEYVIYDADPHELLKRKAVLLMDLIDRLAKALAPFGKGPFAQLRSDKDGES